LPQPRPDGIDVTRDDVIALFTRRQGAWRRHDAPALAADHAEDCVLHSPMAGHVVGRDAIQDVYHAWFAGFPDFELHDEDLIIDGDRVVEIGTVSGTDTGGFMELPPTGKAFRVPVVLSYTLRDGKITRWRTIYDFTGILVQIGMLKAKPV
jgi:steroid delta-isomerase-like uncharacterized protein